MPTGPFDIYMSANRITDAWTTAGAEWLFFTTLETPPPRGPSSVNGIWRLHVNTTTNALEIANAVRRSNTCADLALQAAHERPRRNGGRRLGRGLHGGNRPRHGRAEQRAEDRRIRQPDVDVAQRRLGGIGERCMGGRRRSRDSALHGNTPTSWDVVANVPATGIERRLGNVLVRCLGRRRWQPRCSITTARAGPA